MNKKGYTILELLTVISVVAVLVLVAAPILMNAIDSNKDDSFMTQKEVILKACQEYVAFRKSMGVYNSAETITVKSLVDKQFITVDLIDFNTGKELNTNMQFDVYEDSSGNVICTLDQLKYEPK